MSALNIKKGSRSHSAYDLRSTNSEVEESHTLAVIVQNEPDTPFNMQSAA